MDQIFTLKQTGEKEREKKCRMYVGFMELEKAYDRVNRKALWQLLRMYDLSGKLLNGIKSMYVDNLACVRVKGCESKCFRIDNGVRRVYHVPMDLQCIYERSDEGGENGDNEEGVRLQEEGREWRLPGLFLCR